VAALPELARARALVLDVRENDGGNSNEGYRVLAALADRPFATSGWTTRQYRPAFRSWGRREGRHVAAPDTVAPGAGLPPGAPRFAGPVVVLTSPRTYSAAEDFLAAFRGLRRGRVVGEATGGSTGNPVAFALPGGGFARVCSKHDVGPDGTEFVGVGLRPDVAVPATVADLRAGRDAALAAAVAALATREPGAPSGGGRGIDGGRSDRPRSFLR
jgi:C-terminal processing protease CtpA/Prc